MRAQGNTNGLVGAQALMQINCTHSLALLKNAFRSETVSSFMQQPSASYEPLRLDMQLPNVNVIPGNTRYANDCTSQVVLVFSPHLIILATAILRRELERLHTKNSGNAASSYLYLRYLRCNLPSRNRQVRRDKTRRWLSATVKQLGNSALAPSLSQ